VSCRRCEALAARVEELQRELEVARTKLDDVRDALNYVESACPRCHGDGEVVANPGWSDPQTEIDVPCPDCNGTGETREEAA
jgi:DnaJ-class molecular chaperone